MEHQEKLNVIIESAIDIFSKPGADTLDPNRPFLVEKETIFGKMGTIELTPGLRLRDAFDLLIAIKACNRLMSNPDISEKERGVYAGMYADLMSGGLHKTKINILDILTHDNTFAFDVLTTAHDIFALYSASVINHPSHKESQ